MQITINLTGTPEQLKPIFAALIGTEIIAKTEYEEQLAASTEVKKHFDSIKTETKKRGKGQIAVIPETVQAEINNQNVNATEQLELQEEQAAIESPKPSAAEKIQKCVDEFAAQSQANLQKQLTKQDMKDAVADKMLTKRDKVIALIQSYGGNDLSSIPEDQYNDFIEKAKAI